MMAGSWFNNASAQISILTPLSTTVQQLNTEQTIRYNKVMAQNMHSNYQFVHVETLASSQQNGKIAVSFTNAPCLGNTYFNAENVEYNGNDSNYTWYGDLSYDDSSVECTVGSAMIMARNGEHFGQIEIEHKIFELIELTNGLQLIAAVNHSLSAGNICETLRTTGTTEITGVESESFCKVRLLVLYTPAARAFETNINSRIDLAFAGCFFCNNIRRY